LQRSILPIDVTDPRIQKLLGWYARNGRDLPWRKTRDAYRIFMSELMLQQTQVDRVISLYRAWLKTFPTWKTLANANTSELIHAWAGLGYNRRALFAREAARTVVEKGVPSDEEGWRQLKGVGPYMAAALTEFVNAKRAVVIDTNVRRVAGRLLLGEPYPTPAEDSKLRAALERVTPTSPRHRDLPQAFMDLGSLICKPDKPACAICPLRDLCKAAPLFLNGHAKKPKRKGPTERIHAEKKYPDRIYRGRILAYIRTHGPTSSQALGPQIDPSYDAIADLSWVQAMCERLISDGFLTQTRNGKLSLSTS
jgi:A/G-specific adenine glycosylase